MRLLSIRIDGFGRLVDVEFNLKPGLNVFFGPNEAGKSTLQQAILALLYGFFKGTRRTAAESEFVERFYPWHGSSYGGQLVYQMDGGRAYRVIRSFGGELDTSIVEADTGRDVTAEFEQGRLGRLDFVQKHFGMSREVFINTCFVRQADLHQLEQVAQSITETIANLADTGDRDRSIVRAKLILENALKEQVGSDRAFTKPLPTARTQLATLTAESAAIEKKRQDLEADYESRRNCKSALEQYSQELDNVRYLLARQRYSAIQSEIGKAEMLVREEKDLELQIRQLGADPCFPTELRDVVTRLCENRSVLVGQASQLEGQVAESAAQVLEWEKERNTLLAEARRLEPSRSIPIDGEGEINQQGGQWWELSKQNQAAEKQLIELDRSIAEKQTVGAAAQSQRTLFETGAERIQELALLWQDGCQRLRDLSAAAAEAKSGWQTQNLSPEEFARLSDQVAGLDPGTIADLKAKLAAEQAGTGQPAAAPAMQKALLIVTAGLVGLVGLSLVALGLFTHPLVSVVGVLIIVGDILLAAIAAIYLHRASSRSDSLPPRTFEDMALDLAHKGLTSVADVESAYWSYLRAQPCYQKWIDTEAAFTAEQQNVEALAAQLSTILGLSPLDTLTEERLVAAAQMARQLGQQLVEVEQLERQRAEFAQGIQTRRTRLANLEQDLHRTLTAVGLDAPDLSTSIAQFVRFCQDHRRLDQVEARARELEAKLEGKRAIEGQLRSTRMQLEGTEKELRQVLYQAGITNDDPESAVGEFQKRLQRAQAAEGLRTRVSGLARERAALLGSQSLEQLRSQEEKLARDVNSLLAAHPNFGDLTCDDMEEVLQAHLDEIRDNMAATRNRLSVVEDRITNALAEQRGLAEVEEEIAGVQELIARITEHAEALELAEEQLLAAADEHHRDFLPRLNGMMGQSLEAITDGHYKQVTVDHADLQVRVEAPEIARPVTPELLSRGTQEQIYLLLRLGLTELLSEGRERLPLILDDPLVNYDQDRLRCGLEFLADISQKGQILLFTKDQQTALWFESKQLNGDLHCLHRL